MNKEELTVALAGLSANRVLQSVVIIEKNNIDINDLLELSLHRQKEIAFRAAWMLEYLLTNQAVLFSAYLTRFLDFLPEQYNPSAMRHFSKMVAMITDRKADSCYQQLVKQIDFAPLIELLFTHLIDPQTLVATKVHCMQALANLAPRYEWIKEELPYTIDHLITVESIAFFARAKMVRKQLKRSPI
ncbi:hypothetical protein [Pedobacter sp. MR2016-24]|uniref:hypothetical protein n=1 Tax=Pedobacter sp. MR2016-24 TaxID=2994466 RepID=UPI0022486BED|nr:hypothetical protein [Pedobacter sp. MR2016-24]MCX2484444.1 hypothetical protein [Pedobacter sp. MR2016-24]